MKKLLDVNNLSATVTQLLTGASGSITLKLCREFEFGISAIDIANLVDKRLDCRCLIPLPGIQRNRDGSLHRVQRDDHTESIEKWMRLAQEFDDASWRVRLTPGSYVISTYLVVDVETSISYTYLNNPPGPVYSEGHDVGHYAQEFDHFWEHDSYGKEENVYQTTEFDTTCRLIIPDFETISCELMAYFAEYPDKLQEMEWRKFEELLDAIFRNQGYHTELGPGSGDGGVDIRLIQKDSIGEVLTLVQAKRYNARNPIGLEAVQALHGVVDDQRAHRGLFVTTSRYLPGAREFAARQNQRLILATSKEVATWCKRIVTHKNA